MAERIPDLVVSPSTGFTSTDPVPGSAQGISRIRDRLDRRDSDDTSPGAEHDRAWRGREKSNGIGRGTLGHTPLDQLYTDQH